MPITTNFTSVYSQEFEINFSQCYLNGKLKHTELCNLLQQTAAKHAEMGGISFNDMQQFDQAWVMSKLRIEIDTLPELNEKIIIKTWIKSIENSKSIRAMEIFIKNQKIASCETLWVVFNTKKRISESIIIPFNHFELFSELNVNSKSLQNILIPKEFDLSTFRKVVLSDIDNVCHVNNIKYLEWCLDLMPVDLILDSKIRSFEMNFMRELILNDSVEIGFIAENMTNTFLISKNNKKCFALQIEIKS